MDAVFLLWHTHRLRDEDDDKLIGVYRTEQDAKAAVQRLSSKPGFINTPEGFHVDSYELNKDHWTDGYFTV